MKIYAEIERKITIVSASRAKAEAEGRSIAVRIYDEWLSNLYRMRSESIDAPTKDAPVNVDDKITWYDRSAEGQQW